LAQLTVFPFQRLDAITLFGCHSVAHAAVLLSLLDPSAQGLGNTADLPLSWFAGKPLPVNGMQ
jgi:hypothetical protein